MNWFLAIWFNDENLVKRKSIRTNKQTKKNGWRNPGWQHTHTFFNIRRKYSQKRTKQIINVKMIGFTSWMTNKKEKHTQNGTRIHLKSHRSVYLFFRFFVTKWMFDIDVIWFWFSGHEIHFRFTSSLHQTTNV